MHPADIQSALKKKGVTQKALANALGVSEIAVSKTINKHIVSDRIMRAIAAQIDTPAQIVFPEYYQNPPKRSTSKRISIS